MAVRRYTSDDCLSPRFQRSVETSFRQATPVMEFLCAAAGVKL